MADKKKVNIGLQFSRAAAAFGQGITGQPFLTNIDEALQQRREGVIEQQKASKLGTLIKDLDLPGADKIGTALEEGSINTKEALSLSSALQKGQPSALDLAVAQSLGIDLSVLGKRGAVAGVVDETKPIERPTLARPGLRAGAEEVGAVEPARFKTTKRTLKVGPITETQEAIFTEEDKQRKLDDLKATGEVESQKQLNSQILKNREKSKIDTLRAELKIGNTLDSFIDLVKRNQEITGVAPGPLSGLLINILTPTQLNEFRDGFQGGLIEVAAASARISMPGTRAVRAITLFKKTTVSEWETVESAIQTSADSYRNAITTNMGEDPKFYIEDYKNTPENNRRLGLMSRDFEKSFKRMALDEVFNKNPELLLPETRRRLEQEQRLKAQSIRNNPDRFELIEEE